jgi:hypothetical protein
VMIFLVSLSGCVLLGLLLWRHCELCIGWDHSGRQCWGPENRKGPPNTNGVRFPNKYTQVCKSAESRNLRKSILASKVVNTLHVPSFIGRRRDFYLPRLPSNLENIPSVNIYMNVFYISWFAELISYIYKPTTRSHLEPRLLASLLWPSSFTTSASSQWRLAGRQLPALYRRNLHRSQTSLNFVEIFNIAAVMEFSCSYGDLQSFHRWSFSFWWYSKKSLLPWKQEVGLRFYGHSVIVLPKIRGLVNHRKNNER